jgi:choline dehydrogenase-like flavoprotein
MSSVSFARMINSLTAYTNVSCVAPITRVSARKEVILSAGTFNTPQLLMLSGIGNKTALDALGIESVIDLPGVGQNSTSIPKAYILSWPIKV